MLICTASSIPRVVRSWRFGLWWGEMLLRRVRTSLVAVRDKPRMALQLGQNVFYGHNTLGLLKPALSSERIIVQVLIVGLASRYMH